MSDNQVVSSSNSKYISIVPENGEVFNPSQKIIYNIEPSIGFIKRDTYLIFDVLNTSANSNMVAFPQQVGAHALIENIRIYSKMTGVLLEALENYSQIQGLIHQYGYDDKTQLNMKEGVGLPCCSRLNANNGGNLASNYQGVGAHFVENLQLSVLANTPAPNTPRYVSRRFCIPLRAGLFRTFDSERLIPILNMGGLRIEINLAPADLALQRICCSEVLVGSAYGHAQRDLVNFGVLIDNRGGGDVIFRLTGTHTGAKCGLCVGNSVRFWDVGVHDFTRTITAIADDGAGNVDITVSGAVVNASSANTRLFVSVGGNGNGAGVGDLQNTVCIDAMNYQITSTEMRICQVVPTPEQAKTLSSALNYEFTSYDVFLDNIDGGTLRHQVPINSVSSKALGIISMPYRADYERNNATSSYFAGETPSVNGVNSVQFFINNKLYPLREYNPHSLNDRVICLNEVVKALKAVGIPPKMLGVNEYGYIEDYNNTWVVARELARSGFVFDLRNAEGEIRLGFGAVRAWRTRVNTFVFSKKIIETTAQGVQVVL